MPTNVIERPESALEEEEEVVRDQDDEERGFSMENKNEARLHWPWTHPKYVFSILYQWLGVPQEHLLAMVLVLIVVGVVLALVLVLYEDDGHTNREQLHSKWSECQSKNCTWKLVFQQSGDNRADDFGYSVKLSQSGHRLAVGAATNHDHPNGDPSSSPHNYTGGYVHIYQENHGTWSQLEEESENESCSSRSILETGAVGGVSMSADGRRLSFLTEPEIIDTESHYYCSGTAVLLEEHDQTAEDEIRTNSNHADGIEKEQQLHDSWAKLGGKQGDLICDGAPVLSYNDGSRAVCFGPRQGIHNWDEFYIQTYDYLEPNGTWLYRGKQTTWDGDACRPLEERYEHCYGFGYSRWHSGLSLSSDGTVVVASYTTNGTNNNTTPIRVPATTAEISGVVIYQWDESLSSHRLWHPMLYSYCSGSLLLSNTTIGHCLSLALSGDGKRLAVGDSQAYNESGVVHVYETTYRSLCDWHAVGDELRGSPKNNEWFGASVSLSQDGTRLAVGASSHYQPDDCNIDGTCQNGLSMCLSYK